MSYTKTIQKTQQRNRRRARIRARVHGTATKPRLSVFKSNTDIYAQLINDEAGETLAAANSRQITNGTKSERAAEAGKALAAAATKHGIEHAVFDRGGFIYTGRVKALADGVRDGGLQF